MLFPQEPVKNGRETGILKKSAGYGCISFGFTVSGRQGDGYTCTMFSIYELCAFLLLVLVIIYWWRSREQHAVALTSARKYCQERDIQLLDDTLVFRKYSFAEAGNKKKYFSRIYTFDFCMDGTDRHKGEIVLRGFSVIRVLLETEQLEITQY